MNCKHRNRRHAIPALAAAALAAAAGPVLAGTTTVYDSAGFESPTFATGALDGQGGGVWVESGGAVGGAATVLTGSAMAGVQAVTLSRITSAANGGDKRYWPNVAAVTPTAAQNLVTVSWDMDVAQASNTGVTTGPFFGIEAYAPGDALVAAAGVDATTGEVLFENPAAGGAFANTTADDAVTLGAWHHYQLAMNYTTDTATVSVDGSVRQTVPSFLSTGVAAFADADLSALATGAEPANQTGSASFDNYSVILGPSGPQAVAVAAGQTYHFTANANAGLLVRTVGGLTVAAGATAVADAAPVTGNRQLLALSGTGLTLAGAPGAWTGLVDLGNNDMDVTGGSLATLTNQIAQGYAGGTWAGTGGVTSSAAAADPSHLSAVGVIQNVASDGVTPLYPSFDGQPATAADVLVRLTLYGDANLDGVVNAADYTRIDLGYVSHLTGWGNGDYNYDGVVDGSDYTLMDNAYDQQAGTVGSPSSRVAAATSELAPGTSAVPEPATLAAAALAGVGLLARRRPWRRNVTTR